ASGSTSRSPWAWMPSLTGMARSRSRWMSTGRPVAVVRSPSVVMVVSRSSSSGTSGQPGVLVGGHPVGPGGRVDGRAQLGGDGQAVAAAGAVALGAAVGGQQYPGGGTPDGRRHVVEGQVAAGVAGVVGPVDEA